MLFVFCHTGSPLQLGAGAHTAGLGAKLGRCPKLVKYRVPEPGANAARLLLPGIYG